jgi:uncharacterized membrane protein
MYVPVTGGSNSILLGESLQIFGFLCLIMVYIVRVLCELVDFYKTTNLSGLNFPSAGFVD